jgi:ribosome-binding factor A
MPLHKGQGNEHFREALAQVLVEVVEFPPGVFVTVLEAKISPSQHDAVATLSILPADRQQDVLSALETYRHDIKDSLAKVIRLRQIPKFEWRFDETGKYVERIDKTIEELKKKGDL